MHFLEVTDSHPSVDLGRFQGLMAKQLLHGPDICFILQHRRGTGMPESMRGDVLLDLGLFGVFLHHLPDHVLGQAIAPGGEEERVVVGILNQLRTN
jgi:hypothetical protein